jgi:hypothetical protein
MMICILNVIQSGHRPLAQGVGWFGSLVKISRQFIAVSLAATNLTSLNTCADCCFDTATCRSHVIMTCRLQAKHSSWSRLLSDPERTIIYQRDEMYYFVSLCFECSPCLDSSPTWVSSSSPSSFAVLGPLRPDMDTTKHNPSFQRSSQASFSTWLIFWESYHSSSGGLSSWLRHYATSGKIVGLIPGEVIAFFNWPIAALWPWGRLSLLTEISTLGRRLTTDFRPDW